MKALLKTACGCTRMIDIKERKPTIRLAIKEKTSIDYNMSDCFNTTLQYREFIYDGQENIFDDDILIYKEMI